VTTAVVTLSFLSQVGAHAPQSMQPKFCLVNIYTPVQQTIQQDEPNCTAGFTNKTRLGELEVAYTFGESYMELLRRVS
jgi:hypothetical protein